MKNEQMQIHEKGKPVERRGRKTTGLRVGLLPHHDSRVAERVQCVLEVKAPIRLADRCL